MWTDCYTQHSLIKRAQKEIAIEELLNYKGDEKIIYFQRETICPICGLEIKTLVELRTTTITDGYLD